MTAMVEDLLMLARLDAGRELAPRPVDLTHLLLDVVERRRGQQPRAPLRAEAARRAGRPWPAMPASLHQVFANLLANTRVHTPPGTRVVVRLRRSEAGTAVVTVLDDGPGIDARPAAGDLRAVRPRGRVTQPRRRQHRPRPGHRPGHRGEPPRHGPGHEPPRPDRVHRPPAAPAGLSSPRIGTGVARAGHAYVFLMPLAPSLARTRRGSRRLLGLAALGGLALAATACSPAASSTSPPPPASPRPARPRPSATSTVPPASANPSPSPSATSAENLPLADATRAQLTAAAARLNGLPASAYLGLVKGESYYGFDPATNTYWAGGALDPSPSSQRAQVSVQDDGGYYVFVSQPAVPGRRPPRAWPGSLARRAPSASRPRSWPCGTGPPGACTPPGSDWPGSRAGRGVLLRRRSSNAGSPRLVRGCLGRGADPGLSAQR